MRPIYFPFTLIIVLLKELTRRSLDEYLGTDNSLIQKTKCFEIAMSEIKSFIFDKKRMALQGFTSTEIINIQT